MEATEREARQTALERFLEETGLNEEQALGLMQAAYRQQKGLMERARQVIAAVEAIGDERFTLETLRANPEAMRALEEGLSAGEVYRRYFLRAQDAPAEDVEANLGLQGLNGETLSPEQIERISQYVSRTGNRYELD